MHCIDVDCFEPAYLKTGAKNFGEAIKKIADYLFKHKDNIISRGFTEEVTFTLGQNQIILKGKNVGRKKDLGKGTK